MPKRSERSELCAQHLSSVKTIVGPIPARRFPNETPKAMTEEEKRKKRAEAARRYREKNKHSPDYKTRKSAQAREYYSANKDHVLAYQREYRDALRGTPAWQARTASYRLKHEYGITKDQFDSLLAAQNFSCAICSTTEPRGSGTFHVDHCHESGAVRGLLCLGCNAGLGNFRDNPTSLMRAIEYLTAQGNCYAPSETQGA